MRPGSGSRVDVLCDLACFAELLDHQAVRAFLDHAFQVLALVPRDDDEPARVFADSLVERDRDGEGGRAGGIGALAEKLDRVVAELLAEPLEPLVHLPEDVLVQRPSLGSRHKSEPYPAG